MLGFEFADFKFDDDVAELFDVQEKQVDVEVVAVDVEVHLASHEREAGPEFLKGSDDEFDERLFDVSFVCVDIDPEEART